MADAHCNSSATSILEISFLTAEPYEGYHFERWQDGDTQNPRTVTVTADATYIAHFAADSTPEPPDNPDDPEGIDDVVADGI